MFYVGSYKHALDAKNRLFIPAKFREHLGNGFFITRKFEPCLSIYSSEEWEKYAEKIAALPDSVSEDIQDFIFSNTIYVEPDGNGRVVLSNDLIQYAGIDKNVVIVGAGKQIKIWAEDKWNQRESNRDYDHMKAVMAEYGL